MAIYIGTAGNDNFTGTNVDDSFDMKEGQDVVTALDGADYIQAFTGADVIYGNGGGDVIHLQWTGSTLPSQAYGGAGNDSLRGTIASSGEQLYGDLGADTVYGNEGADVIYGSNPTTNETDSNRLFGGSGNDQMFGSLGADTLATYLGNDDAVGNSGNDRLDSSITGSTTGVHGVDRLWGQTGTDHFIATADVYNPGSSYTDIKDYVTGETIYFRDDLLYTVFGSGISYTLQSIPVANGSQTDQMLRVNVSNGFQDDWAVVRNRTTAPNVNPLDREIEGGSGEQFAMVDSLTRESDRDISTFAPADQSFVRVPQGVQPYDPETVYRGEWVLNADGFIGQAFTVEANFSPESVAGALPDWVGVAVLRDNNLTGTFDVPADVPGDMTAIERFASSFSLF